MEQTFLFNIPLSILFLLATSKLLSSCTKEQSNARYMLIVVTAYCLMSMISGGHYTYEPPQNFSLLCNVTIAGETLVAFALLLVSLFIHRSNANRSINHRYSQLSTNDLSDSNVKMSVVQPRQWKSKMSDDDWLWIDLFRIWRRNLSIGIIIPLFVFNLIQYILNLHHQDLSAPFKDR